MLLPRNYFGEKTATLFLFGSVLSKYQLPLEHAGKGSIEAASEDYAAVVIMNDYDGYSVLVAKFGARKTVVLDLVEKEGGGITCPG